MIFQRLSRRVAEIKVSRIRFFIRMISSTDNVLPTERTRERSPESERLGTIHNRFHS